MDRGDPGGSDGGKGAERELRLKIHDREEFLIVTPRMLSTLIVRIHGLSGREFTMAVRDLMPGELEAYLEKVINTNRHAAPCFQYKRIPQDPITRRELHRICRDQLKELEMDRKACFRSIVPAVAAGGEAGYSIVCGEVFLRACKDAKVKFFYVGPDGEREALVLGQACAGKRGKTATKTENWDSQNPRYMV